jgi:hypothetical protein
MIHVLVQAIGGPAQIAGKLRRFRATVARFADPNTISTRLERLRVRGQIDRVPNRAQLVFGGIDMVRFVIAPAARVYYRDKRITYWVHHLFRIFDDPAASLDPSGVLSTRETIVGHLLQVVHLGCCDPIYDLEVLECLDDGVPELERQLRQLLAGTHPRQAAIETIIADPTYHARLLDYVIAFRTTGGGPPAFCTQQPLIADPQFVTAQQTFATLVGFVRYAAALPSSPMALARRLIEVREFAATPTRLACG